MLEKREAPRTTLMERFIWTTFGWCLLAAVVLIPVTAKVMTLAPSAVTALLIGACYVAAGIAGVLFVPGLLLTGIRQLIPRLVDDLHSRQPRTDREPGTDSAPDRDSE